MFSGTQTFGEKLTQWMTKKGLTASELAAYMRETRDATISRLMHDQLDYQRCARFITELNECYPDIDEETLRSLRVAVDVNRYGREMYLAKQNFIKMLTETSRESEEESADAEALCRSLLAWCGERECRLLLCTGLTGVGPLRFLELISKKRKDIRIHHFFDQSRVAELSGLLAKTLSVSFMENYELYEFRNNDGVLIENILIARREDGAHLLVVYDGGKISMLEMEKGTELYDFVLGLLLSEYHFPKKINRRFSYNSPQAYRDFLSHCLLLESNKAIYQIKSEIGLEYMPTEIIYENFRQWACQNDMRFMPYLDELKEIFAARHENILTKTEPTYLIMTKEGLTQFAKTGRMKDHPFCLRAFTPDERKIIFKNLKDMTVKNPSFMPLILSADAISPEYFFIGYGRECMLVCAAQADYDLSDYTEIVLDSRTLSGQFADFVTNILSKNHVLGKKASLDFIQSLISQIGDE